MGWSLRLQGWAGYKEEQVCSADWGPLQAASAACPVAGIVASDDTTSWVIGEGHPQWPVEEQRPPASRGGTAGAPGREGLGTCPREPSQGETGQSPAGP